MKRAVVTAVTLGVAAILAFFIWKLAAGDVNRQLQKAANEINRRSPLMIDSETRLDGAIASDNMLTYRYTFVNSDRGYWRINAATLKSAVIDRASSSPEIASLFKSGVTLRYIYNDRSGKLLAQFDVTPKDAGY
jgi:hypothetical protein